MQREERQCRGVVKSVRLLTNLGVHPGSATNQLCLCE